RCAVPVDGQRRTVRQGRAAVGDTRCWFRTQWPDEHPLRAATRQWLDAVGDGPECGVSVARYPVLPVGSPPLRNQRGGLRVVARESRIRCHRHSDNAPAPIAWRDDLLVFARCAATDASRFGCCTGIGVVAAATATFDPWRRVVGIYKPANAGRQCIGIEISSDHRFGVADRVARELIDPPARRTHPLCEPRTPCEANQRVKAKALSAYRIVDEYRQPKACF